MVSTRHHPTEFPEPQLSPNSSPSKALTKTTSSVMPKKSGTWAHSPSNIVLMWLFFSLPVVLWDTGYVLLRPYSMPGGSLHSPIWTLYGLYGTVDYMYGWPAWNAHNGFTSAQGSMNLVETLMYSFYIWTVFKHGKSRSKGGKSNGATWWLQDEKVVPGMIGALGLLVAFAASMLTLAKTVLYWANEAFSGFENIGHNDPMSLLLFWIIPNGLWLFFPTAMAYAYGMDILDGLAIAMKSSK